jgi:AcrR family transcriptional regulator
MKKKEIQEMRVRGYFIQATKEILKGEGMQCVNVRNIAERAGYSYATLYNYFKDIKELIFFCVKDFEDECEAFIKDRTIDVPKGKKKITAIVKAYTSFFVEYPSIFELFFIEKMIDVSKNKPAAELITSFLDRLCLDDWNYCVQRKRVTTGFAERKKKELKYSVVGLLLFYMNRRQPENYSEFVRTSDQLIRNIMKGN